jgi:hypothetical protein
MGSQAPFKVKMPLKGIHNLPNQKRKAGPDPMEIHPGYPA